VKGSDPTSGGSGLIPRPKREAGKGSVCTHGRGRGEAGHAPEHGDGGEAWDPHAPDLGFGCLGRPKRRRRPSPRDRRGGRVRADSNPVIGGGGASGGDEQQAPVYAPDQAGEREGGETLLGWAGSAMRLPSGTVASKPSFNRIFF
jgi:hypothetical protein